MIVAMIELTRMQEPLAISTVKHESPASTNALLREAQLVWKGISAGAQFFREGFDENHRTETMKTSLYSAGLTFALACLKRSPSLAWTSSRVVLPAMSVSFFGELANHAAEVKNALADNWTSANNWERNSEIMKQHLGRTAADFAISSIGSGIAEVAARSYFGHKTPGVKSLPELSRENLDLNWDKHMKGEVIPYRMFSAEGGGMRRVDLFLPPGFRPPGNAASGAGRGLLIAPDGLELGIGALKNLKAQAMAEVNGLANLNLDSGINYVAAFPHPKQFRVIPGVNVAAWFHKGGLIEAGGLFAPASNFSDVSFLADIEKTMRALFATKRTTIAGFSSGAILGNELAARLGPDKVQSVISVASTVTGKEPPAPPGQFRFIVRDTGDPTLPQAGGAGSKSRLLAALGHDSIKNSMPINQIKYGLEPYPIDSITERMTASGSLTQRNFALTEGRPVLSYVELRNRAHAWPNRIEYENAGSLKFIKNLAGSLNGISREPSFELNQMIKEIVNGDLQRFVLPGS